MPTLYIDGELKVKKEENMKEFKYKVGDEVLVKGKVIEVFDPAARNYPYRLRYESNNPEQSWTETVTETVIAGKADEFVKVDDQKTYEQGLNDAWEMAKLICMTINKGGLPTEQLEDIYDGYDLIDDIMETFCAQRAINKYNEWKERNEFKMGDIVEYDIYAGLDTYEIHRAIFYSETVDAYWVLRDQCVAPQSLSKDDFTLRKVGESGIDIAGALSKIREKED